jgi:nicotinamide mononucleotide transporter
MTPPIGLEVAANGINALSIVLAARNNVHTWWTGILGCAAFLALFYLSRLYADALLQVFFIAASTVGWLRWSPRQGQPALAVTRSSGVAVLAAILMATAAAAGYGWALWRCTDAFAPFLDSAVLALSVAGQLLLMDRKYDAWWFWLAANTVSVTLFAVRGLWVTAILYALFWVNAVVALVNWRRAVRS